MAPALHCFSISISDHSSSSHLSENLLGDFSPTSNSFHGRGGRSPTSSLSRCPRGRHIIVFLSQLLSFFLCRRPVWHLTTPRRPFTLPIAHAHSRLSSFDLHPLNLPAAPSLMRREYYVRSRPNRESLKILKVGNFGEAGIKVPKWPRKWPQFDYTPSNNNFRRRRPRLTFLLLSLSLFLFARSFFPPLFLT